MLKSKLRLIPQVLNAVKLLSDEEDRNCDTILKLLLYNLNGLPENYIVQLSNDVPFNTIGKEGQYEFLNILSKEEGCQLVEYIEEINSVYDNDIYKLITSTEFTILPPTKKLLIMKYLPGRGNFNLEAYQEQIKFLLESKSAEYAFALLNVDSSYLEKALEFIADEDNIGVLHAKFKALKYIKSELRNRTISLEQYQKYLEILDENLEDKSNKEKKKYLKARSKYFKGHRFSNFINSFDLEKSNEGLTELLESEKSVKKMNQYYDFAHLVEDYYDSDIVNMAVDTLSSIRSKKNTKMFVKFITSPYFLRSDINRQKTLLKLFSVESKTEKLGQELEIEIPEFSYLEEKVLDSSKPLEFTNKETRIKVIVKSNKN